MNAAEDILRDQLIHYLNEVCFQNRNIFFKGRKHAMISHKYKCIFIHIQRTAGTSIENWIVGKDWWRIDKETKHLLASQAKVKYRKYWDKYFKFSFVRNPWDRVVSCLIFPEFYGISYHNGMLNFDGYKSKYGYPVIIENDFRFSNGKFLKSKKHMKNSVYLNILDEELDFVVSFVQVEDGIRDIGVTGVQTCALPI